MDVISYLSAAAFETRVCGKKTIEVDALKKITEYPTTPDSSPYIKRFWRVFKGFSQEERQIYLKFVWGRTRLPIVASS